MTPWPRLIKLHGTQCLRPIPLNDTPLSQLMENKGTSHIWPATNKGTQVLRPIYTSCWKGFTVE